MKIHKILGLGMASMLAACHYKDAEILVDKRELEHFSPDSKHLSVLRFKTPLIEEITGIPTPLVQVYKGIWDCETKSYITPNIRAANSYSFKVAGALTNRSIMSVTNTPSERYVPDSSFTQKLFELVSDRIIAVDSYPVKRCNKDEPIISTIPLWCSAYGKFTKDVSVKPTTTYQWKVESDVHQTVYFPYEPSLYRATIEYDILKAEFVGDDLNNIELELSDIEDAFGLRSGTLILDKVLAKSVNSFGKMSVFNIDDADRKALIYALTRDKNIYSLGRYATLRNIGMDDIAKDIISIDRQLYIDDYSAKLRMF